MTAFDSQYNYPLRQQKTGQGERESEEEWEMDWWRGRERERTLIIPEAFPPKICGGRLNRRSTIDSITRQTLQGLYTTTHRRPYCSRAGCWFFFLPLLSLPVNVCPSSGAPGRRRNSGPCLDFNLLSHWLIPLSVLREEPQRQRQRASWRVRWRAGGLLFVRLYSW